MYIYVLISSTPTKFGSVIRKVGHLKYNHAAIAFDENFDEIYAFARQKHTALLLGKLVKENYSRYTLNKADEIQSVVFKIPVSAQQYDKARSIVNSIKNDDEYMYNFLSVFTYPISGGMHIYKSFSCIEFVVYLLAQIGFETTKPNYQYRPDDLLNELDQYIFFEGNLCEFWKSKQRSNSYFAHLSRGDVLQSFRTIGEITKRGFAHLIRREAT